MVDFVLITLLIVYGIAQMVAGYLGIDFHFGSIWAAVAIIVSLMFRFTLPITIGAFFGAMEVWGWHWALAALFAVPGLVFLIPSIMLSIMESIKR